MVRKYAGFAAGLALIVALGSAIVWAKAVRFQDASHDVAMPCEPASSTITAEECVKAAPRIGSVPPIETPRVTRVAAGVRRFDEVARAIPRAAPRTFPPLFHRPPPAWS